MTKEKTFNWDTLRQPILVISTVVGRGMYNIGEAITETFPDKSNTSHIAIEDFLPRNAVNEDLKRYEIISNRFPFLLYLIYKIPIFYYRKYFREKYFKSSNLMELKTKIESIRPKTIVCVSHRPAFWVSNLKRMEKMDFELWGILGEYGNTLGWKYIFWESMNRFLSPVDRKELKFDIPIHVKYLKIDLPVRQKFCELSKTKGDVDNVLLVCGFWGQGPLCAILKVLTKEMPQLKLHVVCGENIGLYNKIKSFFYNTSHIHLYGVTESLAPLLEKCASVITKPGISTILECRASHRKMFLLKGMPIAEDNNARYAIAHFNAQWFNKDVFKQWHASVTLK